MLRLLFPICLLGVCACLTSAAAGPAGEAAAPETMPAETAVITGWVFDGMADVPEVPEPSGLCYVPERDTLFVVDDGGTDRPAGLYELDLHSQVLQGAPVGTDLEGVCWCPADGLLYLCDEAGETLHAVDPDGLQLIATYPVAREWKGREVIAAGGNGFEGIEYIAADAAGAGDYFLVLNQDDPTALLRIDRCALAPGQPAPLAGFWELAQINAGELYYDAPARELWVVHSWMNVIEIVALPGMAVQRWEVCPGCAQEAVARDGQGRLWIGYDTGGIARYLPED